MFNKGSFTFLITMALPEICSPNVTTLAGPEITQSIFLTFALHYQVREALASLSPVGMATGTSWGPQIPHPWSGFIQSLTASRAAE